VTTLRVLGAARPFVLAAGHGAGSPPLAEDCAWHVLESGGSDMIEAIRAYDRLLARLPAEAREAIDRYDPDGVATVWGGGALVTARGRLDRRPATGTRAPQWSALEDKVVVDEVWDAAGVRRAPSEVVAAERAALAAAAARLDRGAGTVWAGDARQGVNGGAVFVRWVRDEDGAAEAAEFLSARCDRARVMPFLEGIPCSIHGMVLPDRTIAFRPCELATLREAGTNRFLYAGMATFWDPPAADRDAMRAVAVRAGETLRRVHGYRGAFGIDGVLTEDGFRPTELNARYCGHTLVARSLPELPLGVVNAAVVAGAAHDYRSAALEAVVVEAADTARQGAIQSVTTTRFTATTTHATPYGDVVAGPSGVGGFLRLGLAPERVPVGPPVGPRGVALFAWADAELGTAFGPLEAARPVRA